MNLFNVLTELRPIFSEDSKVAFSLFGFDVAWYAVIILCGAILAAVIGYYGYAKRLGVDEDTVLTGVTFGLFFGILGARLYYVLFDATVSPGAYDSFFEIINLRDGGLAIHGGIIAAILFVIVYSKIKKIKVIYLLEIVMPVFMLAQAVGRWGNFMNQEAFGTLIQVEGLQAYGELTRWSQLSDSVLLAQREVLSNMLIPDFIIDRMYIKSSSASGFICAGYYYPTFLFESFFNLIGAVGYMILRKYIKKIYVGDGVSFYLIWYGVLRFFIEMLRTDPLVIGNTGIKIAQLISIICIVIGLALAILRRVFKYKLIPCAYALHDKESSMMEDDYVAPVKEPGLIVKLIAKIKNKKEDTKETVEVTKDEE